MRLRRREQFISVSRGHDVASGAIKQTESELSFELSYQHAQSRGSNVECFRRSRETAMLRDQLKCPQLSGAKLHCCDPFNKCCPFWIGRLQARRDRERSPTRICFKRRFDIKLHSLLPLLA